LAGIGAGAKRFDKLLGEFMRGFSGDSRLSVVESAFWSSRTPGAAKREKMLVVTQFREVTGPPAVFPGSDFERPGLMLRGETEVKSRCSFDRLEPWPFDCFRSYSNTPSSKNCVDRGRDTTRKMEFTIQIGRRFNPVQVHDNVGIFLGVLASFCPAVFDTAHARATITAFLRDAWLWGFPIRKQSRLRFRESMWFLGFMRSVAI